MIYQVFCFQMRTEWHSIDSLVLLQHRGRPNFGQAEDAKSQLTCFVLVVSGKWNVSPKPKEQNLRGQKGSATRRCHKLTKPDLRNFAIPGPWGCGQSSCNGGSFDGYLSRARPMATNPRMAGSWGAESGCGQKLTFCWSIGAGREGKSIDLGVQKDQGNIEH